MNKRMAAACGLAVCLASMAVFRGYAAPAPSGIPELARPNAPSTITYSPSASVSAKGTISFKNNGYSGAYYIVFRELSLTPSAGEALSYGLFADQSLDTDLALDGTAEAADQTLSGTIPGGLSDRAVTDIDYYFAVLPATMPSPATYSALMEVSLYTGAWPSGTKVSTESFTLKAKVGQHLDVAVVEVDGAFSESATSLSLDLGTLEANGSASADIIVRSNLSYTLSLTSTKGGLVNLSDSKSIVSYALSVDGGAAIDLPARKKVAIASGQPATYRNTQGYTILVTIPQSSDLPTAGTYTDTITISVAAP